MEDIDKLLKEREVLNKKIAELNEDNLIFSVDAGIIDRFGKELVGKAETAVSELIKNAYDADATKVLVSFIDTNETGGTIIVEDNGNGMTRQQLIKGFMTISSPDKVFNPTSPKYKRQRAGRKGIGRFATQRIGNELIIITQTKNSKVALKVNVDWTQYKIDQDITSISNPVEKIEKECKSGTKLIIKNVKEGWKEAQIKRVYRYVTDLLQPNYLSGRSKKFKIAIESDPSFQVSFFSIINGEKEKIADSDKMLLDRSLAVFEGKVDKYRNASFSVTCESPHLFLKDKNVKIWKDEKEGQRKYDFIQNIYFKAYYFIYNRTQYYTNPKIELRKIEELSKSEGGIKLYRNGFRVLPYGTPKDDWLGLDRKNISQGGRSIPYSNRNFFGFVEVIDIEGELFQETASREGLIENEALIELKDFLFKSISGARNRLAEKIVEFRKQQKERKDEEDGLNEDEEPISPTDQLDEIEDDIDSIVDSSQGGQASNNSEKLGAIKNKLGRVKKEVEKQIEELGMIRVLAGLGLVIGEFTHEMRQFSPSFTGHLVKLDQLNLGREGASTVSELKKLIKQITAYTSFFDASVSRNVSREIEPIDLKIIIKKFFKIILPNAKGEGIEFLPPEFHGFDLYTTPMHPSEWQSILFNLYTNSKKAILKKESNERGKISVIVGAENDQIYLEFLDNGIGIPEKDRVRIFTAFFTTSTPAGYDSDGNDELIGTGLGLKIIKDIVSGYKGNVFVNESPKSEFKTCIRIEIPKITEEEIEKYDL